jgi:hypothetical protein
MKDNLKGGMVLPKGMKHPKIKTFDDVKRFLKRLVLDEGEVVKIYGFGEEVVLDNDSLVMMRFKGFI